MHYPLVGCSQNLFAARCAWGGVLTPRFVQNLEPILGFRWELEPSVSQPELCVKNKTPPPPRCPQEAYPFLDRKPADACFRATLRVSAGRDEDVMRT